MMKKIIYVLILLIITFTGVLLSVLPISVGAGVDKIYHFIGFFIATLVFNIAFIGIFGKKYLNYYIIFALIAGGIVAAISEKLQTFSTVRSCDALDWLVNVIAIALAIVIIYFIDLILSKKDC
jgi:VanZ family protein